MKKNNEKRNAAVRIVNRTRVMRGKATLKLDPQLIEDPWSELIKAARDPNNRHVRLEAHEE